MQSWDNSKTRRITTVALLAAAAFVLSWVDSMLPVSGVLPGAKLGLANLSVLTALYLLGPLYGFVLCLVKVALSSVLFGNAFSFFYAIAGGLLSYAVMLVLYKRASTVFVSVMGGMFHNIGQIAVAAVVLQTTGLWGYLPVLLLCGLGAGCAVGLVGGITIRRLRRVLRL